LDYKELAGKLLETAKKYQHLLIYIKGSPDPDALAASYALKLICDSLDIKATIVSPSQPSLPQNIKMIKDLRLPVRFENVAECKKVYDAYAVLDHQSVKVDRVTGVIPCAFHIDHHEDIKEEISVDFRILSQEAGSASTVMTHLLERLDADVDYTQSRWQNAATALYYGIKSDTDDLRHAEALDRQAIDLLSAHADQEKLNRIAAVPFTKEAMKYLKLALQDQLLYKDWLICGIGFIPEKHRDQMGIIGDFLLKREDINVTVVFGIVERDHRLRLDASFRTKQEDLNLNALIKKITRDGGARKFKGAFQVNLDYFTGCPDRQLLWDTVNATTIETLKQRRDDSAADDFWKFFKQIKRKVKDFFD
jgi:nanoRNase/pAp phosphatase (c-di-AMP/oligoRNAs hydrolase)